MSKRLIVAVVAAVLLGRLAGWAQTALISPSDIAYLGAFRLPPVTGPGYSTWEYSNGALGYYPGGDASGPNDGYPGSLFMAGHVYESRVAEIEIPAPVVSKVLTDLPVARLLQPMQTVTAGLPNANGFIMGMAWIPAQGRVFFTHGSDYNDGDCWSAEVPGLGSFQPALGSAQTQGLWFLSVGGTRLHPFQSLRYIAEVPQAWADANLAGRSLATGRYRGWCLEGPNLYASAPWPGPTAGSDVPATTVMEFGTFGDTAKYPTGHSYANAYRGAAWLTTGDRSAFAISGIIDFDPAHSYYGYENWKTPPECEPFNTCQGHRGWRQADPHPALLLFDPADLAAVTSGAKASWDVDPYAVVDITAYMLRPYTPTFLATGAGAEDILATVDRDRGLLYVSESFADGMSPVVHVFRIGEDEPPSPPGITTQPASQTVNAGQPATFSVAATGTAPLAYQWQKNGVDISGATGASYTTPAAVTDDTGSTFRCLVTNAAGAATSESAALTVVEPPRNAAPRANAGRDQKVKLSAGALLAGSVIDDGLPNPPGALTAAWSKVKGPGTVSFANPSAPATTASFSRTGTYELKLSASDGVLAAWDKVTIRVQ